MISKLSNFLTNFWVTSILLLVFIFPFFNFKIGIAYAIFPAIEIIFIYYFYSLKMIKLEIVFIISLLLDQFFFHPMGTSSFSFVLGCIAVNCFATKFILINFGINCLVFCSFTLVVLMGKYMIFILNFQMVNDVEVIFQYLTTISIYPSFKMILDRLIKYETRKINP